MENERRDASYFRETGSNAVPDVGNGSERCDIFFIFLPKINFPDYQGPWSQGPRYQVYGPGVWYQVVRRLSLKPKTSRLGAWYRNKLFKKTK